MKHNNTAEPIKQTKTAMSTEIKVQIREELKKVFSSLHLKSSKRNILFVVFSIPIE